MRSFVSESKRTFRSEMLAKRNSQNESEIHRKSEQIQKIFIESRFFEESKVLGIYLAHGSEVRTQLIIDASFRNTKIIAAPKVVDSSSIRFYEVDKHNMNSITKGKFDIPEPNGAGKDYSKAMDLVIVPGIAFDLHGYRLGHGLGYYDNFLRNRGKMIVIGLAFDFQITKTQFLPHSELDMKVDNIVSEKGFHSLALD